VNKVWEKHRIPSCLYYKGFPFLYLFFKVSSFIFFLPRKKKFSRHTKNFVL